MVTFLNTIRSLVAPETVISPNSFLGPQRREVVLEAKTKDDDGDPQGVKDQYGVPRIDKAELESLFKSDGVVFNALMKAKDLIMSAKTSYDTGKPYIFEGNATSVRFFDDFYDSIGDTGSDTDDFELFERTWLDQFIYGEQYTENIFNKKGNEIVDLDSLDPKAMHPVLNAQGSVVVDNLNRPVGFIKELPLNTDVEVKHKFKIPEKYNVTLENNQIFFPNDHMTFHKYLALGDGQRGLGLIEPIYNMAKYKFNVEDAYAQSWLRVGQPMPVGYVGDETHEPTEGNMKQLLDELKNINNKSALVFPNYSKVELLEPKRRFSLRDDLDHFVDNTVTGTGVPNAFALGRGDTNRAIIGTLKHFMEISLLNSVRKTLRRMERQQIARIAENHNNAHPSKKIKPVKIKWGEFSLEELDSKAKRLMMYAQAGMVLPYPELESYLMKLEGLPKKDELQRG